MKNRKVIHILNGQEMYHYFQKHHLMIDEIYLPFNEAMCMGDVNEDIFSDEFISRRCKVHQVTLKHYREITLNPLQPILNLDCHQMVFWFDEDMFCQINLLTLLGYLDCRRFKGDVIVNLVGEGFNLLKSFSMELEGYYQIYKKVMIDKQQVTEIPLPSLKEGTKCYLELQKKDNEIVKYIKCHPSEEIDSLLSQLFDQFSNYGLGDTQYLSLIHEVREESQ